MGGYETEGGREGGVGQQILSRSDSFSEEVTVKALGRKSERPLSEQGEERTPGWAWLMQWLGVLRDAGWRVPRGPQTRTGLWAGHRTPGPGLCSCLAGRASSGHTACDVVLLGMELPVLEALAAFVCAATGLAPGSEAEVCANTCRLAFLGEGLPGVLPRTGLHRRGGEGVSVACARASSTFYLWVRMCVLSDAGGDWRPGALTVLLGSFLRPSASSPLTRKLLDQGPTRPTRASFLSICC